MGFAAPPRPDPAPTRSHRLRGTWLTPLVTLRTKPKVAFDGERDDLPAGSRHAAGGRAPPEPQHRSKIREKGTRGGDLLTAQPEPREGKEPQVGTTVQHSCIKERPTQARRGQQRATAARPHDRPRIACTNADQATWPGAGSNRRPSAFQARSPPQVKAPDDHRSCDPRATSCADLARELGGVPGLREPAQCLRDLPVPALHRVQVAQRRRRGRCPSRRFKSASVAPVAAARVCPVWPAGAVRGDRRAGR